MEDNNVFEESQNKEVVEVSSDYIPKKKAIIICVSVLLILALIAGAGVGGYFFGKRNSLDDNMPLMAEAYEAFKKYYYKDINWEEFQVYATAAMMTQVDDYTGMYLNAEVEATKAYGFSYNESGINEHIIYYVMKDSPAATTKATYHYSDLQLNNKETVTDDVYIEEGDKIYAISMVSPTAIALLGADPIIVQGMEKSKFKDLLAADENAIFYIIKSNGNDTYNNELYAFRLEKEWLSSKTTEYYSAQEIGDTTGTTALLKFRSFSGSAIKDFHAACETFVESGATNLILDLRGNGGGNATILSYVAGCLLNGADDTSLPLLKLNYNAGYGIFRTTYFSTEFKGTYGDKEYQTINLPSVVNNFKLVVLCDSQTASSSEALIGALMYYNDTKIVGGKTYGKGVAQTIVEIGDGKYYLNITNGTYYIPTKGEDGKICWDVTIHGVGITPDSENKISKSYRPLVNDLYIKRGLELITA